VIEKSQENIEILRRHKAHGGYRCYAKATLLRRIHQNNAPTTTSVGHRHTGTLITYGKINICKKSIRHLERSDKKVG